jgi:hypothetical protein
MEALFRFLAGYELLIYIILGISLLFTIRWLWQAYIEIQDAVYGLEHQIALRHLTTAIGSILLILLLVIGELIITSFIVPDLPASTFLLTPTVSLLPVTQSTPGVELSTASVGTSATKDGLASETSGCVPGKLAITKPSPGQGLNGVVEIFGSVQVQDLGFYKIEFSPQGTENWATFYAGRDIKPDQSIGVWDTSQLLPGDYQIRLVATDNQGVEISPCVITIRVTGSP